MALPRQFSIDTTAVDSAACRGGSNSRVGAPQAVTPWRLFIITRTRVFLSQELIAANSEQQRAGYSSVASNSGNAQQLVRLDIYCLPSPNPRRHHTNPTTAQDQGDPHQ
jgi:hypothetical protein